MTPTEDLWAEYDPSEFRLGVSPSLYVWQLTDDDDYSEPSRRMIVVAPTWEAAEALWDDRPTRDITYARPVFLKGWHLRIPGPPRVLHTQWLAAASSEAA